jgi:hypothetical protein
MRMVDETNQSLARDPKDPREPSLQAERGARSPVARFEHRLGIYVIAGLVGGLLGGQAYSYSLPYSLGFPAGFALIGLIFGGVYCALSRVPRSPLDHLRVVAMFCVTAFAFSALLHVRYETGIQLSSLPFYKCWVSFAVGLFVFFFCALFYAIDLSRSWLGWLTAVAGLIAALPPAFSGDLDLFKDYSDTSMTSSLFLVVTYLVFISFFLAIYSYMSRTHFDSVVLLIFLMFNLYVAFPFAYWKFVAKLKEWGVLSLDAESLLLYVPILVVVLLGNLYHLRRILPRLLRRRRAREANVLRPRYENLAPCLILGQAILPNYLILAFPLAIIPYFGTVHDLGASGLLALKKRNRSLLLGLTALVVYWLFFEAYDAGLFDVAWPAAAGLASICLGYCLFDDEIS